MVNFRQVIDFFRNNPITTAVFLIFLGIACNFFGGLWFDEFAGIVGGGITFMYLFIILSIMGMTRAFD
jgi:hypothetical protein